MNNLQTRQKELRKYQLVGIQLSINDNIKSHKSINIASVYADVRNTLCNLQIWLLQFTGMPKELN